MSEERLGSGGTREKGWVPGDVRVCVCVFVHVLTGDPMFSAVFLLQCSHGC